MTSGLRERKKLATRHALHEAALHLVAAHGLDGVSVDDIAARADVSPRTFFNYFATKDDAVVGLDPAGPAEQAAALAGRPASESAVEALRAVTRDRATAAELAVIEFDAFDGDVVTAIGTSAEYVRTVL